MTSSATTKVAFQGVLGANGEIAALHCLSHLDGAWEGGAPEPIGYEDFAGVLEAVEKGEVHLAVLPIENSLAGTVTQAVDLLFSSDLYAVGEVMVRVHHQLLAPAGTRLEDVQKVYSHPQALAQCARFLKRHAMSAIPAYDTAGAAQDLAASLESGAACIATARAGELYGLECIAQNIQDEAFNTTRFLVLSSAHRPILNGRPYKTSVVFAVRNTPGSLVAALSSFAGINMTKLESRPRRDRSWSYLFYLDCEGHTDDPRVQSALAGLLGHSSVAKVLGSYPASALEVG